jgi:stage II sporulation protein D
MNLRPLFITLACYLLVFSSYSQVIDVGLYYTVKLKKVIVIPESGTYEFYGDGVRISELGETDGLRIEVDNGKISLKSLSNDFGSYGTVEFKGSTSNSLLNIKGIIPSTKPNPYNDRIKVFIDNGYLQIINQVNIENYVAGVVESEAGKDRPVEFYKAQSIISRTYALANFRRHATEGFQLCDQVHCQVYHGKSRYEPLIPIGVMKTKGMVLVDSDISLITAAFSSNCGGKTRNSENVWSKPLSYLKSVPDTFCLNGDHANWRKTVSRVDWENYKKRNTTNASFISGKGAAIDNTYSEFLYGKQDLNAIRSAFKLNSTRFVIEEHGNEVNFIGQGFGHGVGLCQEGAIRMAELGFSYREILEYYYTNIHLIQLSTLNFFKWD